MSIAASTGVSDKGLSVNLPVSLEIFSIENHHEAYYIWKNKGFKNKVLIHIDAHIDFFWISDKDTSCVLAPRTLNELVLNVKRESYWNLAKNDSSELIDIGNYIYPAIKEGIIKEFYWVVPDYIWDNSKQRKYLEKIFLRLRSSNPECVGRVEVYKDRIETELLGVKTAVLKLSALKPVREDVLLDIDVDYMLTQYLIGPALYFKKEKVLPWMWPEELVEILKEKQIKSSLTTIAYSVEQGFTPLEYKFLGDELNSLLQGSCLSEGYLILRKAAESYYKGDLSGAAVELNKKAASLDVAYNAACRYLLSRILKEQGRIEESERCLLEAVDAVNSYKTIYNNPALRLKAQHKHKVAIKECIRLQNTFPQDTTYRLLLAEILFEEGKFDEALPEFLKVIEAQSNNNQAYVYAGRIHFIDKRYDLALQFLNKAVLLSERDAFSNYWLGMAYAKIYETRKAVKYLQKSVVLGVSNPEVYFQLAKLYFRERNFYKAREKFILCLSSVLRKNLF